MTLSEVSPSPLAVAKHNAAAQKVNVHFVTSDLFNHLPGRFDFVVTNLPYIAPEETSVMDQVRYGVNPSWRCLLIIMAWHYLNGLSLNCATSKPAWRSVFGVWLSSGTGTATIIY